MAQKKDYFRDEQGNLVGFDQIYDLYFEDIFHHILRRVGNATEAEDLTAVTFEKVLQSLGQFQWRGAPLASWLYKIATNQVNSYFRRQKRQMDSILEEPPSVRLSPEQELFDAETEIAKYRLFGELNKCIRELKLQDQTLIVMRYLENRSFKDIAAILNKRTGTVITRTHRALSKLKVLLEKRGINDERFRKSIEEYAPTPYSGRSVQAEFAR